MHFAFCIFKYFPFGGLQQDFLKIARQCKERGHLVDVYTRSWQGEKPEWLAIHIIKPLALTNIGKDLRFMRQARKQIENKQYNAVIGFNKMPGLDVYFAGDPCYAHRVKKRNIFFKLSRRNRHRQNLEKIVFGTDATTNILLLTLQEKDRFQEIYFTDEQRFHLLPPGLNKEQFSNVDVLNARKKIRKEFAISDEDFLLLFVGSGFRVKGLDRALITLASLVTSNTKQTSAKMIVVGQGKNKPYEAMAKKLGIASRVHFAGGCKNVEEFYRAGDLLIHPAYSEGAGKVLLEAVISGLPVLTTDVCGYAPYILESDCGIVLDSPFKQESLNQQLAQIAQSPEKLKLWAKNGIHYGMQKDLYSMHEKAAEIIEKIAIRK